MTKVRNTKALHTLLSKFEQANLAISVVMLIKTLKQDMNRVTVYRILQRLENEGVLHSFIGGDGLKWYARWEGLAPPDQGKTHLHFQCNACGKIECMATEIPIPDVPNHKVESASFLLLGTCADCNGKPRIKTV